MKISPKPISNHVKNLAGQRFGRLTVTSYLGVGNRGVSVWQAECDCGSLIEVVGPNLTKGHTSSCGCLKRDEFLKRITKHGHSSTTKTSPEYSAWRSMLSRCSNESNPHFKDYGGRGITVCERWKAFGNFLMDAGVRPSPKHSIHRINNDLGYFPENVKWAMSDEQQNAKRTNHEITFGGKIMNLMQWAEKVGIHYVTLHYRLRRGWTIERALTTPLQKRV